jgi:hypothetical protein
MRSSALSMLLASILLGSGTALAQPSPDLKPATFYVCTAAAQVVEVSQDDTGTASTVIATGTGSFSDCVVGPDGGLYIGNDTQIVRIYPGVGATPHVITSADVVASGLTSPARALSFNVWTLYINTESSGIYQSIGTIDYDSIQRHLTFSPETAVAILPVVPPGGHGLTFDVEGNMVIASGGSLLRSATHQYVADYATPANLGVNGSTPFGLALNTCQDVLFTDTSSRRLKLLVKGGGSGVQNTSVTFARKNLPLNLEVDSSNRAYVLLAEDEIGTNAKVVLAAPTGAKLTDATNCANLTVGSEPLVDLKAGLKPGGISGLTSAQAVGIAVAPTAHQLSIDFSTQSACDKGITFDFGYHNVTFYFANCPSTTISVKAQKSLLGDVQFDLPDLPAHPDIHSMPYSALGGLPLEYVLNASPALNTLGVVPSRIKYGFFTQEPIGQPGLARAGCLDNELSCDPAAQDEVGGDSPGKYRQDVTKDFWDVEALDAAGGEGERDFSKRVVYNSSLGIGRDCVFAGPFEQPLDSNNPLFNSPQTIKISLRATGTNCTGGQVHVSIVRVFPDHFEPQEVTSSVQTGNLMEAQANGKYTYSLNASGLNTKNATKAKPAQFEITLWGDVAPLLAAPKKFSISK